MPSQRIQLDGRGGTMQEKHGVLPLHTDIVYANVDALTPQTIDDEINAAIERDAVLVIDDGTYRSQPADPWIVSREQSHETLVLLANLCIRAKSRGVERVGVYGFAPWVGRGPTGRATFLSHRYPKDRERFVELNRRDAGVLLPYVDFLMPSCYWAYLGMPQQALTHVASIVDAARRIDGSKPVVPFISARQSGRIVPLDEPTLTAIGTAIREHADGHAIFLADSLSKRTLSHGPAEELLLREVAK